MKKLILLLSLPVLAALWSPAAPARTTPGKVIIPPPQERIDQTVDKMIGHIDEYWHEGKYEEIAVLFSVIVELDPHHIESWQNYGWLLWSGLSRKDEAESVFRRGIAVNPDAYELYFEMGNLEYHRRRFLSAAQWLAKATGRGAPWTVWHQRAHCLEYAGEREKCVALWREIVRRFPDNPTSKLNLRRVEEGRFRDEPTLGVEARPLPDPHPNSDAQPDPEPESMDVPEEAPAPRPVPPGPWSI